MNINARERAVINNLERLQYDITIAKSLMRILGEHFDCNRYKDNMIVDHYSITYMFDEYRELSYDLSTKLVNIENKVEEIIKELYQLRKGKDYENNDNK